MATAKKKRTTKKKAVKKAMESVPVNLEKRVVIGRIEDLKSTLISALETDHVRINGSAVEAVDTASLQLLVAFFNERRSRDLQCSWDAVSDEFVDRARITGLQAHLGLDAEHAAAAS